MRTVLREIFSEHKWILCIYICNSTSSNQIFIIDFTVFAKNYKEKKKEKYSDCYPVSILSNFATALYNCVFFFFFTKKKSFNTAVQFTPYTNKNICRYCIAGTFEILRTILRYGILNFKPCDLSSWTLNAKLKFCKKKKKW